MGRSRCSTARGDTSQRCHLNSSWRTKMKNSISYLSYRSNREKQNVIIQIRNFLWHWGHHLCYSQKGQGIFIDHMQPRTLLYVSADGQPLRHTASEYSSNENLWQNQGCWSAPLKGRPFSLFFYPWAQHEVHHQTVYWETQVEYNVR